MTTIGINGAAGRMGRRLVTLASDDPALQVTAALEHRGHELLGRDAGIVAGVEELGVALSDSPGADAQAKPRVIIDFSVPAATRAALELCRAQGLGLVIGTTGLSDEDHGLIDEAARDIPVLQAPNMSLGVNLLFALAARAAKTLGDDYDVEITETHHRFKKDAPSGTALGLAAAICDATGKDLDQALVHSRHGSETPRRSGQIGMHALRLGDVVGRHTAHFATLGEELQLTHIASNRDVFVLGALRAAKWLGDPARKAGRYAMAHVLGL